MYPAVLELNEQQANQWWNDLSPAWQKVFLQQFWFMDEALVNESSPAKIYRNLLRLDEFEIFNAPVDDLTPLMAFKHIKSLGIDSTDVNDICVLKLFENLEFLSVQYSEIKCIDGLATLKNLKNLAIKSNHVSNRLPS